jgi:very-short-patch-repair endonuclease
VFEFTPRDLRRRPTVCEKILWSYLRARQMVGFKFRRQHPLGPFIVDFVCLSEKIIIELDGPIHEQNKIYDARRDFWLASRGYSVIRIKNEELLENQMGVLKNIRAQLMKRLGF